MVNFQSISGYEPPVTTNNAPVFITHGMVFRLEHNVTVTLIKQTSSGSWDAAVIKSSHDRYPVGGYHINVFEKDLRSTATYIPESDLP